MNKRPETVIRDALFPDERLLWCGTPVRGLRLTRTDVLLIPFSIMWGGFAIVWEVGVIRSNAPFFFRLWGIPFVLIGLYMMVGRFFWDSYRRAHTAYGLTNERIIIVIQGMAAKVVSLRLANITELTLNEATGPRGTIHFGTPSPAGWGRKGTPEPHAFVGIQEVRRVHQLIREAQRVPEQSLLPRDRV